MQLSNLAKQAGKFVQDNSPAIMTAIGVTGTLVTAYLTGHASYKAAQIIEEDKKGQIVPFGTPRIVVPPKYFIKRTWKLYIPAALTAAATVAAIIGSNRVGARRAAAMATAFTLTEKAFEEYRTKVVERLGATKEEAVREEIAQERLNRHVAEGGQLVVTGRDGVYCFESYTGRIFKCDMETLRRAQNDINLQVLNDGFASLADFYELIGLPKTSISDEIGWTTAKPLELRFATILYEGNTPCISFDYAGVPVRNFDRFS